MNRKKPYDLNTVTRKTRKDAATPYDLGALGGMHNDEPALDIHKKGFPEMGKVTHIRVDVKPDPASIKRAIPKKEKPRNIDTRKRFIKAKFIGQDGSLGYTHGKEYVLRISNATNIYPEGSIHIERYHRIFALDGEGGCVYGSILSFLENWTNIISDNQRLTLNGKETENQETGS